MNKIKAVWASLPRPVQALAVAFIGGCGAEIGKISADYPNICITAACLKHDVGLIIGAGIVAARAFYMIPNNGRFIQAPAEDSK